MFRLKEIRLLYGMSQLKLSEIIGVSRSTVAMWESGSSLPDYETLIRLADYFDCSTDYLLGRVDHPRLEKRKAPPESGADAYVRDKDSPKELTPEEIAAIRSFLESQKK